jgi:hypothetical protein
MEHPEVAYRLAVERQLELERAVDASRRRSPGRGRLTTILAAVATGLARRPTSLFRSVPRETCAGPPVRDLTHRPSNSSTR